jgi:hypothetical protein
VQNLNELTEIHRFAGGKASKVVGGIMELLAGRITDDNLPLIDGTSLYALGDSPIVGNGTYSFKNGPLTTRSKIVFAQKDIRTECVKERISVGFWATATVNMEI